MEANTLIPCCLYPTTVTLIDDDIDFSQKLSKKISERVPCTAVIEPEAAASYIKANQLKNAFVKRLSNDNLEDELDSLLTNINVRKIRELVYDKERFNGVTVAIVDYAMPKVDGLTVCRQLDITPLKKAMLTGQADTTIAVKAFNDKLIDRFYVKDIDSLQSLPNEIKTLQKEYFIGLTDAVISDAIYNRYPSMQCLKDTVFSEFFEELCEKEQIVEYYLTDTDGSFVLFDKDANLSCLSVKTDNDMQYYYEIASDTPDVSPDILSAIQNKTHVPYFLTQANYETPASEWEPFMHKATHLHGNNDYYVAYIKDDPRYVDGNHSSITSFSEYMSNISNA